MTHNIEFYVTITFRLMMMMMMMMMMTMLNEFPIITALSPTTQQYTQKSHNNQCNTTLT